MEINYRLTAGLISASPVRMGPQHHRGQLLLALSLSQSHLSIPAAH